MIAMYLERFNLPRHTYIMLSRFVIYIYEIYMHTPPSLTLRFARVMTGARPYGFVTLSGV